LYLTFNGNYPIRDISYQEVLFMSAEDIVKKLLAGIENSPSWTASDARNKFDRLLDQALEGPQVIAPMRGHKEKFVCISMAHLSELSDKLQRLDAEVRRTRVSKVLEKVRQFYDENPDAELTIVRDPEKPAIDFES
jgi:prevent-host-death family protein